MNYYTITMRGPSVAEIRIDGAIGESWFEETTTAQSFTAELAKVTASTINLYLNSPGGSVMDANVIYAALQRHPATINVVIDGWALSAASLIAMAGNTVAIGQRSLMMIHNPATIAAGDAHALRKSADVLDKIKIGMVDTYNTRMNLAPDTVAGLLDAETWYSAKEAVAMGLADSIIPDTAAPAPVPAAIRNQFSFVPAAYAAYLTESAMAHETLTENPALVAESDPIIESAPSSASPAIVAASPAEADATAVDVDARVAAGIKAERERVKAVRAAFAPWMKRGYDLTAVLAQCEDEGLDIHAVNAKLLATIGAMAEPLATGQGAPMPSEVDVAALQRKIFNQVAGKE